MSQTDLSDLGKEQHSRSINHSVTPNPPSLGNGYCDKAGDVAAYRHCHANGVYIQFYTHIPFMLTHKHRHKDNRKIEEDHTFNYPIQIVSLGDKRQDI